MPPPSEANALESAIFDRVLEFDGETTGPLETACEMAGKDFTGFARLFELTGSEDTRLQIAATWAVRKLLELGAELTGEHCNTFIETAATQTAWEAQLHVVQSVQFIRSEDLNARRLAKIIAPWHAAKRPFLRAWTLDAICHLAQRDAGLKETATALLTNSEKDPAASVRARVRNLRKYNLL